MYSKIVVPLDGSELSENALKHAQTIIGQNPKAILILLRAIEPFFPDAYYLGEVIQYSVDAEKKAERNARQYLSKVASRLRKEGISHVRTVILQGRPDIEIMNYLAKRKVDLVVMTTHGRSGISHWLMGSVAERVMRHSPVPVLVVPPPGSSGGTKKVIRSSEHRPSKQAME